MKSNKSECNVYTMTDVKEMSWAVEQDAVLCLLHRSCDISDFDIE